MMIFMFYQVEEFDMGNKLFGTDGVRGVANVYPMTAEFALKLGMAAGQLFAAKHGGLPLPGIRGFPVKCLRPH